MESSTKADDERRHEAPRVRLREVLRAPRRPASDAQARGRSDGGRPAGADRSHPRRRAAAHVDPARTAHRARGVGRRNVGHAPAVRDGRGVHADDRHEHAPAPREVAAGSDGRGESPVTEHGTPGPAAARPAAAGGGGHRGEAAAVQLPRCPALAATSALPAWRHRGSAGPGRGCRRGRGASIGAGAAPMADQPGASRRESQRQGGARPSREEGDDLGGTGAGGARRRRRVRSAPLTRAGSPACTRCRYGGANLSERILLRVL